jgi:23S rRNA (cytosine1962-C5)-methyltransferase
MPLERLLARAWPRATRRELGEALRLGQVRVAREVRREPNFAVPPGAEVTADVPVGSRAPRGGAVEILARGADWVVVDKPAGWPSHAPDPGEPDAAALVAAALGVPREQVWPAHRLDADVSGVWLVATTREAAARLSQAFAEGKAEKRYGALAPAPAWPEGTVTAGVDGAPAASEFEAIEVRDGLALLALSPRTGRTHQLRRHLAALQGPPLGDVIWGGVLVDGGLRLVSAGLRIEDEGIDVALGEAALAERLAWPVEAVFPPEAPAPSVVVSQATVRALRGGHPWVLTDTETGDVAGCRPGALLHVVGPDGRFVASARAEGPGRVAARVWTAGVAAAAAPSVAQRVGEALRRRAHLAREAATTDAYRVVHGEGDGLPGLFVDRLGDALRVLVTGKAALPLVQPVAERVRDALGLTGPVVEVLHLGEQPKGELRSVRVLCGGAEEPGRSDVPERMVVHERGLRFEVELGLGQPSRPRPGVGLFLDQRANRERLAALAPGRRWLNLFCHTGAFSVALLAAGAAEVVSVDLSRPYLAWLETNLRLNGLEVDSRHASVRMDARRYLEELGGSGGAPTLTFDGVVLDPPTAAAAGKRFWSVRKDVDGLVRAALRCLAPGGVLLLCRNDRHRKPALRAVIEEAARSLGHDPRRLRLEDAPPGEDFPRISGFPEGDAFEGLLAREARREARRGQRR